MRKKIILFSLILLVSFNLGFALSPIAGEIQADKTGPEERSTADVEETIRRIQGIPVLMYHHILPETMMSDLAYNAALISFESFRTQMKWLKDEGWQALSLDDLHLALSGDDPLPEKTFAITFDDGYASNLYFAFPTLNLYNYPAAEFIITANLEEDIQKWNGKKLSWNDTKAMSRLFSIQSHSHAFHQMEEGAPLLTIRSEEEIRADLDFAWAEIDRHIQPGLRAFAYPYGVASQAAIKVLKDQGVQLAFTTERGYATKDSDPLLLPRFGITPSVTMEDFQNIFTGQALPANPVEETAGDLMKVEIPTMATKAPVIQDNATDLENQPIDQIDETDAGDENLE